MSRRGVLCVPASESRKVVKALSLDVDEVVVDLEDAVSIDQKEGARAAIADLPARNHGRLAVRANALGTPWADDDVAACVENRNVESIVVPKSEDSHEFSALARRLDELEKAAGRAQPLGM